MSSPTEKILEQIQQAQTHHVALYVKPHPMLPEGAGTDWKCALCGFGWPCDASRLARQLEAAVKALEEAACMVQSDR